jgi:pSer/pThr/pTyr-binding forkhead associated (FHA) protein
MIDDFDLSASHCMIKEKNGVHEIIDLNSRNGVWVNGIKIQQQVLCDEDMINIGKTCMLYRQGLINYVSDKKIL